MTGYNFMYYRYTIRLVSIIILSLSLKIFQIVTISIRTLDSSSNTLLIGWNDINGRARGKVRNCSRRFVKGDRNKAEQGAWKSRLADTIFWGSRNFVSSDGSGSNNSAQLVRQQFGVSQKIDERACNIIAPWQITTTRRATTYRYSG